MNNRTTIQLTETTKDDLEALKRADGESYESVVRMLIAHYNNSQSDTVDESRMREIAREEITDRVVREALE
jgi:myosin-crossreactive antigen